MSGNVSTVKVTFLGDATDLARAGQQADKAVATSAGNMHSSVSKFGKAAGVAFLAVAAGAVKLGMDSIHSASDLAESLSKTKVVFGAASKTVEDFAGTAARSLGISKQAALEAGSTFGNLMVALKLPQQAAAGMSISLVKLAGDLASFNNVPVEDALLALKSGLLGEAEPMRKFGVSLSAARVDAEALAMGLVKPVVSSEKLSIAQTTLKIALEKASEAIRAHGKDSTEAEAAQLRVEKASQAVAKAMDGTVPPLTAAQKAQAAYKIMLDDTKKAQGDFGRTSSGLANEQRILSATVEDLKAKFGAMLLPALNAVMPVLVNMAAYLSQHQGLVKALAIGIGVGLVGATVAWTVALLANPVGAVIAGIALLTAGVVYAYQHFETFRTVFNAVFKFIADAALTYIGAILTVFGTFFGVLGHLPGKAGAPFRALHGFVDEAREKVTALKDGIDKLTSKTITITTHFEEIRTSVAAAGSTGGVGPIKMRAAGGPVGEGMYLVGEKGPELLNFGRGTSGFVTPNHELSRLGAGSGSSTTTHGPTYNLNVTNHGDAVMDTYDIAMAFRRLEMMHA